MIPRFGFFFQDSRIRVNRRSFAALVQMGRQWTVQKDLKEMNWLKRPSTFAGMSTLAHYDRHFRSFIARIESKR